MTPASWPRAVPLVERLLVVDPETGALADRHIADLPGLLAPGDLAVVNDAATLPASLRVIAIDDAPDAGGAAGLAEVRLAGRSPDGSFHAILFGAGDWHDATTERAAPPAVRPGARLAFAHGLAARVSAVSSTSPRLVALEFDVPEDALYARLFEVGRPVQYWYHDGALDAWHVQTAFAGRPWAVEMPSAGRPLTVPLLIALRRAGIALASITHAAGLSATGDAALDRALPLPELSEVPEATVAAIERTRQQGGRVIAVGTSVVRALEGAARRGALSPGRGENDLVIGPGFAPRVVDALLTGMHEEGESHYALLAAFAPADLLARATAHAESAGYLCHEFGDATLLLPQHPRRAPSPIVDTPARIGDALPVSF